MHVQLHSGGQVVSTYALNAAVLYLFGLQPNPIVLCVVVVMLASITPKFVECSAGRV